MFQKTWAAMSTITSTASLTNLETHLSIRDESIRSDFNEDFNLGLIFFDVLVLDSQSLMFEPYLYRRKTLEGLILTKPGQAMLADRFLIDMSTRPEETLTEIFDEHKAAHLEGVVLKAEDSWYNDNWRPWVKLKKDYIPGHGDTLDLVIIGAGWEKVRGRKVRGEQCSPQSTWIPYVTLLNIVPPTTLTTFYVGGLANRLRKVGSISLFCFLTSQCIRQEYDHTSMYILLCRTVYLELNWRKSIFSSRLLNL